MGGGTVTAREAIFHVCKRAEWDAAEREGVYRGSSQDAADGFIHFSSRVQVAASVGKHRKGQADLVLVSVDAARVSGALRWEPSRGGQLFPHLYGVLSLSAVIRIDPLPLGPDGHHVFPAGFTGAAS